MGLKDALTLTREGDTLVVTRLECLARSITELKEIVDGLSAKCVGFRCLHQSAVDTTRYDGKLLLNILGSFAEFEADIRRARQRESIQKAKEAGHYRGRKPTIDAVAIRQALDEGEKPAALAKRLGVARSSVYRVRTLRQQADRQTELIDANPSLFVVDLPEPIGEYLSHLFAWAEIWAPVLPSFGRADPDTTTLIRSFNLKKRVLLRSLFQVPALSRYRRCHVQPLQHDGDCRRDAAAVWAVPRRHGQSAADR